MLKTERQMLIETATYIKIAYKFHKESSEVKNPVIRSKALFLEIMAFALNNLLLIDQVSINQAISLNNLVKKQLKVDGIVFDKEKELLGLIQSYNDSKLANKKGKPFFVYLLPMNSCDNWAALSLVQEEFIKTKTTNKE